MSARRFKFISPGIFLNEIDNSQIPRRPVADGPIIIGRSRKGPAMRPYKVNSFEEFVRVFGAPVAGGENEDAWREGNLAGPTYAAYAARAWLAADVAPITFFRLLGEQNPYYIASSGEAGWKNTGTPHATLASNGGAYGVWVCNNTASVSDVSETTDEHAGVTGSLAAIFYVQEGYAVVLSGNVRGSNTAATGTCALFHSDNTAGATPSQFTAQILDSAGAVAYKSLFNFDRASPYFIRNRFNTNPMMVNSAFVDTAGLSQGENTYWLGETYETYLNGVVTGSSPGEQLAFIAAVESGSVSWDQRQGSYVNSRTPWFFSQDTSTDYANFACTNMPKLFRFHGLDHGEWTQNNIKISIVSIMPSKTVADPYGKFDVLIRAARDTDNRPEILERYSNVNLNPDSGDYIARRIGDVYTQWDTTNHVNRQYGNHTNRSEYVRIEMNPDVDSAILDPELIPFGVFGPIRPKGFTIFSGSNQFHDEGQAFFQPGAASGVNKNFDSAWITSTGLTQRYNADPTAGLAESSDKIVVSIGSTGEASNHPFTGSFSFPATRTRMSASEGGFSDSAYSKVYYGLSTDIGYNTRVATGGGGDKTYYLAKFDPGYGDYLKGMPFVAGATEDSRFDTLSGPPTHWEYSWQFSLDDIKIGDEDKPDNMSFWSAGSRVLGQSVTALSGTYKELVDPSGSAGQAAGPVSKFTAAFYGGHDGFDITKAEPFSNVALSGNTVQTSYAYHTLERAIETVADPEYAPANILVMPGITNKGITSKLIETAENRADVLAIVDIEDVYKPRTESTQSFKDRLGSVTAAANSLKDRELNSSYGCTYYPWVQIQDPMSRQRVWVPPSVVALGTFASSQGKSAVWFAPAGFNRGGLSDPATAGMRVLRVTERVVSKDRDKLYAVNINPIAQFPNEGIVVFGQKTLQVTQSALDRINVRRMMIYVKKEISKIAAGILFDQNVRVTWDRFNSRANAFLSSVQSSLGVSEYRVILDETTTTPDLIDRNILYAKIFLKPARAIEFIAIDFIITRTGASFED